MKPSAPVRSISHVDLAAQYREERDELLPLIDRALAEGQYVGGKEIDQLEADLAALCGTKHALTLNSGTDALLLGLTALGVGPGDEVITAPNSFVASAATIALLGARPVFADVLADQNIDPERIEAAITPRTKAIMPVHLTGRICEMNPILEIARRRGLKVIEDAAQAIGSRYRNRPSGSFGNVGCFSCHPLKTLNAMGDAGFLVTNDDKIAASVRFDRNHGMVDRDTVAHWGRVARLDTVQAVILRYRLRRLPEIIRRRRAIGEQYRRLLDPKLVFMPAEQPHEFIAPQTTVVQLDQRDALRAHLLEHGVSTVIHYPVPIHMQPAAAYLGYKPGDFPATERQSRRILTLPNHLGLSEDDVGFVAGLTNVFLGKNSG